MNPFEELLKNLGVKLGIALHPDERQSCCIEFANGITLQIDLDSTGDRILIATSFPLEKGPFQTKVFEHALKWNNASTFQRGILAFSPKKDALVYFQFFPLAQVSADFLAKFLELFVNHSLEWRQGLETGTLPPIEDKKERSISKA